MSFGEKIIFPTPPRQIALFDALGKTVPLFAHMPMILGPDKSKLSKRHGATSVTEYGEKGIVAEAMFNFLTLLGWSPKSEQEIFTKEELIAQFQLESISKSNAVFDMDKLTWMNGQYIRNLSDDDYVERVKAHIQPADTLSGYSEDQIAQIVISVRDNLNYLSEINDYLTVYTRSPEDFQLPERTEVIDLCLAKVEAESNWSKDAIQKILDDLVTETGLGKGKVWLPIRLTVSGQKSGPNIAEFMSIIGKDEVIKRLTPAA